MAAKIYRLGLGVAVVGLGLLTAGEMSRLLLVEGLREHGSSSSLNVSQKDLETPISFVGEGDSQLLTGTSGNAADPQVSDYILKERAQVPSESWICRTSEIGKGCGKRGYYDGERVWANAICPSGSCCSKTACSFQTGCGNLCSEGFLTCGTSLTYRSEFSYGACACSSLGHACDPNAKCVDLHGAGGGSYCVCKDGFTGDGKTCTSTSGSPSPTTTDMRSGGVKEALRSPCLLKPCGEGKCVETGDRTKPYECQCPGSYVRLSGATREACLPLPNKKTIALDFPPEESIFSHKLTPLKFSSSFSGPR